MTEIGTAWRRWRSLRARSGLYRGGLPPSVLDSALAVALCVVLAADAAAERGFWESLPALIATATLAWRRKHPLPVFGLTVLGAAASNAAPPIPVFAAIMIAAYSVGVYSRYRLLSLGVLLATATGVLVTYGQNSLPPLPGWSGPYAILIPMWLVGNAIRGWQQRVDTLQQRAALLQQEQELATRAAVAEERARMARELHDVVAHSVSVMVVQAGAARQVVNASPEKSGEALLAVESVGREALTELRNLLGLLSDHSADPVEAPDLAPQPGMDELASLIQRVGEAGLPVELRVVGRPRALPAGVDLAAYRIVQEALTNALKYSGLARTEVVLDYRDSELKVEVLDEGAGERPRPAVGPVGARTGRGLAGMRERVALYGGRLEAGPRLERGYAVRAWLPL